MKKLIQLSILLITLTAADVAVSAPLICDWKDVSVSAPIDKKALKAYFKKIKEECSYTKKMDKVADRLASIQRPMESLNYYQGLRYVDRFSYEKARKDNIPLTVVFQIRKEDYDVPVAQRSHLVWNNWSIGINTIPTIKNALLSGQPFTLDLLKKIHKSFYNQDESGEYGKVYTAGEIKAANMPEIKWSIPPEKLTKLSAQVNQIDQMYVSLGLQPQETAEGNRISASPAILSTRDGNLRPAHPIYVRAHLENLAQFLNQMVQNARQRKPLIWNNRIFTPLEVALFAQQTIVRAHAFNDGNGRISRYLQDLVLSLFDMPFISSGNLQAEDMNTPMDEYYELATKVNEEQVRTLESCESLSNRNFNCLTVGTAL